MFSEVPDTNITDSAVATSDEDQNAYMHMVFHTLPPVSSGKALETNKISIKGKWRDDSCQI